VLPVVLGLRIFPLPEQVSSRLNIEERHLWVKFCQSVGHRCRFRDLDFREIHKIVTMTMVARRCTLMHL
jgi:hypothetical protein